jgi:hypothetical protein
VFPGVRRPPGGRYDTTIKKRRYSAVHKAIIDDNESPRHIWCFLAIDRPYNGPNWKASGLSAYEVAHIFAHKESEIRIERQFFREFQEGLLPFGDFSCPCNSVLLPKGTARPTDTSMTVKAIFYQRYIDLYTEEPLRGRQKFDASLVPEWYNSLSWNEPKLPFDWEIKIDHLLEYRRNTLTRILSAI